MWTQIVGPCIKELTWEGYGGERTNMDRESRRGKKVKTDSIVAEEQNRGAGIFWKEKLMHEDA